MRRVGVAGILVWPGLKCRKTLPARQDILRSVGDVCSSGTLPRANRDRQKIFYCSIRFFIHCILESCICFSGSSLRLQKGWHENWLLLSKWFAHLKQPTTKIMKSYQITNILLCSAFAVACAGNALANPITTLFNTGVNGSGSVLADGSPDPHYALTVDPSGTYAT